MEIATKIDKNQKIDIIKSIILFLLKNRMNIKDFPQLKESILKLKEKKYVEQDLAIKNALQDLTDTLNLSRDEILKRATVLENAIIKKTIKVLKDLENTCIRHLSSYSKKAPLPSEVTELRFWRIPETVKKWKTDSYLNDKILQETIHIKKTFWEIRDLVLNKKKNELSQILTALVPDNQTALWEEWFDIKNINSAVLPTEKKVEEKVEESWDPQNSWKSSTTEDFDKDLLDFFAPENSTDGGDSFPSVGQTDTTSREEGTTNEWEKEPGSAYNRIKYLKQILDERDVPFEYRLAIIWTNTPEMRREQSYAVIRIEGLNRTVLINNSYGEATYVVTWILDIEDLITFTKKDYQEDQNAVRVRFFSSNPELWGSQMSEALFLPINTELKNDIKKQEEAELERDNMTGRVINDLENMKGLAGESGFESLSLEEQQAIIRRRLQEPENIKKWFETTTTTRNAAGVITGLSWGVGLISLYNIFEVEIKFSGGAAGPKNFYELSERIFWKEYNTDIAGYQEPHELQNRREVMEFSLLPLEKKQAIIRRRLQEPENMKKWFKTTIESRSKSGTISELSWGESLGSLYSIFEIEVRYPGGDAGSKNFYLLSERIFWAKYNTDIKDYKSPSELVQLRERIKISSLSPEKQRNAIRTRLQDSEARKKWFAIPPGKRTRDRSITDLSWGQGLESLYKIFWFDIKNLEGIVKDDNFYELSRRIFWAEYNTGIAGYQEPHELKELGEKAEETAKRRAFDSLPPEEQQAIIRKRLQKPENMKKWFETTSGNRGSESIMTNLSWGWGLESLYKIFWFAIKSLGGKTMDDNFYELSRRIFWAEYNTDIVGYQEPTAELEELRKRAEEVARQRAFESLPLETQRTIITKKLQEPENMKKRFGATVNARYKTIMVLELGTGLTGLYTLFKVDNEQSVWANTDESFYKLSRRIFWAEYNTDIVGYQEPTTELENLRKRAEKDAKRRAFESLPLEEQRTIIRKKLQDSEARRKWFGTLTITRHKTIADLKLGKELGRLYTLFEVDKEGVDRAATDDNFYELSRRIFWKEYNADIVGYQEPHELKELGEKAEETAKRRAFDSLPPEEQQAIIRKRLQKPENMKKWFETTSGNRGSESIMTNLSWGWGLESLYKIFWFAIKSLGGKTMDDNFYELSRRIFGAEYNIDIAEYQEPTTELEDLKGKAEEAAKRRVFESLPLEEQQASIRQKLQDLAARKKWFEANTNTRHKIITDLDLGKGLIGLYTLFEVDKDQLGWAHTDESFYELSKRIFWAEYNTDIPGYQEPSAELEKLRKKVEETTKRRAKK